MAVQSTSEALDSWIAWYFARLRVSTRVLTTIGLPGSRPTRMVTELTAREERALATATGLDWAELGAMTLKPFDGLAVTISRGQEHGRELSCRWVPSPDCPPGSNTSCRHHRHKAREGVSLRRWRLSRSHSLIMKSQPFVVVQAPDDRGLRAVSIEGKSVGHAWSLQDLPGLLRRAGLPPDIDLDDRAQVHWVADKTCWPDRPWRRRAAAMVMALGLLTSVVVLSYVGVKDMFNALAYGGRVMGAIFMVAALVEMVAALALWDYWGKRVVRYSGAAVLLGVGSVAGTNLMFLVIQIEGGYYAGFLWLWIGLALWSVWALWVLTRQKVWRNIPHPRSVALGAAVSAIVGAASLAYSQMYVPYSTPVKVPFGVSFGKPTTSANGAVLHVPAHFELRNTGSVRIYVVGTMWGVKGYPTKFSTEGSSMSTWKYELLSEYRSTLRHVTYSPSRMLGTGEIVNPGAALDPGDNFSRDFTVDVPLQSGIGRVEVHADISYIRADRCKLGNSYRYSGEASWDTESKDLKHTRNAPEWVAERGDEYHRNYSRIYRSSEMLDLTHADDYASAWWVLPQWGEGYGFAKGDTDPYMVASISRHPDLGQRLSDSEQEPYGMKTLDTWTERTIAQLLQVAKK